MARVFVLVLAIGLVPLALGAIVIQRASHDADGRTLDRALLADAQSGSADLAAYFDRARSVALLTSANPVFADFYTLPGSQRHAKSRAEARAFGRVNVALAYLEELYPAALAEACFIDRAGFENARVVRGLPARRSALSLNESINPFFKPTLQLGGLVYQAAPYLSPDTHEWVISNSALITTSAGLHPAMVHFEISIESLRRTLARERGHHLFVINRATGAIIVDSERPQLPMKKLGHPDARFSQLAHIDALKGDATANGTRMAYVGVRRTQTNANDWLVVAAAPAVSGPLIGLDRASLLLLALLLVLIALPIAYRWGRLNKDLTERETDLADSEQRYRVLFEEAEAGRRLVVEQNDRLRKVDRMKDDFVASVSHELRTPLTSISGYVELLMESEMNEEQLGFLDVVRRNADRLLRLVGDLLFAAELDARQVELERAPVDLLRLVTHAFEAARPVAADREIELVLETQLTSALEGDAGRLGQAIDNLLSNALKFTPPGGTVCLRLVERDDSAQIEISDTVMGISEENQQRLFERFFRTSEATEQAIQGTGLGLSISAAIVEGHGGSIEVKSELGCGTTFTVVLPTVKVAEAAAA